MNLRFLHAGLALCLAAPLPAAAAPPLLLPRPARLVEGEGRLLVSPATPIRGDRAAAGAFADLMKRTAWAGARTPIAAGGAITFRRVPGMAAEAYRVEVTPRGAAVTASDRAGLYYGAVTLWQLATQPGGGGIAAVTIDDAPRYRWRGLMLDSARHFQSPAFVKHFIEWMALNKLNRFHWHLVDDQGWRLPVRKWPKLTEVSAWRRPATAPGAPPLPEVGGFYTHAQIREIVAFAAARGVTIVPEIEMPGHALAAIRAYPALGTGTPIPPGTESDWGVFPWLYNVEEPTFRFLEDVLDEVMALFPSKDIHLGGDEATKEQWRASPAVQARMRALGLRDEEALQGWFMARLGTYLTRHGRRMVGWDEILEGGVPSTATIMSWRGVDGAAKAARAGHDTIMAASPILYLDHIQGTGPDEPPGRGGVEALADVLAFDPMPRGLSTAERAHVVGIQANLWTEHVRTEQRAAWMAFPRAIAVAETGWAGSGGDYGDFTRRLAPQLARLRPFGLDAATSAFTSPAPLSPHLREGLALKSCKARADLYLEDDAPATGERAKFLIDVLQPCWRWDGADLTGVTAIALDVGQVPFNFQVGKDRETIRFRPPATPAGEMEVRDGCEGPLLATLPLAPAVADPGVTPLRAPLTRATGRHDLCITYTAAGPDPLWAIRRIRLVR